MGQGERKAKVTAENKKEALRLRALWSSRKHPSQAEFGDTYKIGNQSAVGQFLRGEVPLSLKAAKGFAQGLGCEVADFSPRLAAMVEDISSLGPGSWPFPAIDRARFDALDPEQRMEIQGVVRRMLLDFEQSAPANFKQIIADTNLTTKYPTASGRPAIPHGEADVPAPGESPLEWAARLPGEKVGSGRSGESGESERATSAAAGRRTRKSSGAR